ncbi:PREDICTED: uncharacterized protein LOC108563909 [Nicrophorus vespilloides]|uniref:Uncharacterized protein LOC108563909 n=1 Tax=Nicrophorus vespilloides TaxID=110193 RepID=A0ABM1MUG4_NICVS|nr:PREDICTED: uncharacterized protein LOC108563909 [Nicrophorus vespilloides]
MRQEAFFVLASALAVASGFVAGNSVNDNVSLRGPRSNIENYMEIIKCVGQWNMACAVDRAQDLLIQTNERFLVEADSQSVALGRKQNSDETPSSLIESISGIFSEITEIVFKNGISGLFRAAKEESLEDEEEEEETGADDKKEETKGRGVNGVERGKKKKKKLKAIIKLLVLGVVLFGKITLLLKILAAHLQIKFLIIAAAGLLINAARFYFDLKKGHQPQKVIYYEHAQHQHHYDGGEEEGWSGGGGGHGGGGYWSRRSYENEEKDKSAQDMAYSHQKPTGSEESTNFSWLK